MDNLCIRRTFQIFSGEEWHYTMFLSMRNIGVASDLDRVISELDGIGALLSDNQLLSQTADLLRRQLRKLLHDISSVVEKQTAI